VLDDIFSAIDPKTEALIVERLFGASGLFKKLGSTVILATHASKLPNCVQPAATDRFIVKHLPLADNILVLGADGGMIERGAFQELRGRNLELINSVMNQEPQPSTDDDVADSQDGHGHKIPVAVKVNPTSDNEMTRRIGDLSVYNYYLKSIGWRIAVANAVTALIWTLGSNFPRK